LLKIPHVAILDGLYCFKGSCFFFLILVQLHSPGKLLTKLCALTHSPSLSANWERLWTFGLDKSQARGKYNCIRDTRRSHWQPFCAHVSTQLEWMHAPFWLKEIALSRFSLSLMCLFLTPEGL
jgi:hypothetical protein